MAIRICYFQFDRDIVLKDDNVLERVLDAYVLDILDESIGRIKEKTYIFLDEIQLVPRWSAIVKRYLDRDPMIPVLSGRYQKNWGAFFSDGYIRDIRFFRPIDPACTGLYAMEIEE